MPLDFSVSFSVFFLQIGCLETVLSSSINDHYNFNLCLSIYQVKNEVGSIGSCCEEISVLVFVASFSISSTS